MRVVAGKYRGKKLKEFNLDTTKPTIDRVKESIFASIQFDVIDAVVLDLFSGTGALGIEAISRGAKKVFLVDKNIHAINIIKQNLNGIDGDYVVKNQDYISFLNEVKVKFDIVLLDPPYKTDFGVKSIELLLKNDLLNDNAIIMFETGEDANVELNFPQFEITKKKYGTVLVYKMVKNNEQRI